MLHELRAELVYTRPWLLGGLGIAFFVSTVLTVLMLLPSVESDMPTFLPGMFPIIAGMVVSFIAQSYRSEEHRARLLLAGPLIPRQLAGVMVLLPVCLVGIGALAGAFWVGSVSLITGSFEPATFPNLGMFTPSFWRMRRWDRSRRRRRRPADSSAAGRPLSGGRSLWGWFSSWWHRSLSSGRSTDMRDC